LQGVDISGTGDNKKKNIKSLFLVGIF
jgi:hypothetical protein